MFSKLMAAGMLVVPSLSHSSQWPAVDASLAESAPTSEQVIAYLLKDGPPKPERQFRGLPATDREGLRFGAFENVECTEKSRYQGRSYWRCFYTMTAFTGSGTKLTSRGWEILGRDGKGGLQPIMLKVVATPLAPAASAPSKNWQQPSGSDASAGAGDFCSGAIDRSKCKTSLEESWKLKDQLRHCLYRAGKRLAQSSMAIGEKYIDFAGSCPTERRTVWPRE